MTIAISAGHYPEKPGACFKNFCEHEEALRWVELIMGIIERLGDTRVVKVPPGPLRSKVQFINTLTPVLALEIHFNALVDENGKNIGQGCMTLHYPHSSAGVQAAEPIQRALASVFPPDLGMRPGYYRLDPKFGPDFFLARTTCPALILEPEFIHHRGLIVDLREEACEVLADAIVIAYTRLLSNSQHLHN